MIHIFLMFIFVFEENMVNDCFANNYNSLSRDHDITVGVTNDIFQRGPSHLVDRSGRRQNTNSPKNGSDDVLRTKPIPSPSTIMLSDKLKKHVQRSTQKQYEIINMLWRKTRIFLNEEDVYTTIKPRLNINQTRLRVPVENPMLSTPGVLNSLSTTASNIEFYYNDEDLNHEKQNGKCTDSVCNGINRSTAILNNKSFHIFHLKAPFAIPQLVKLNLSYTSNSTSSKKEAMLSRAIPNKSQKLTHKDIKQTMHNKNYGHKIVDQANLSSLFNKTNRNSFITQTSVPIESQSTTIYDKIKFFELYDQFTEKPAHEKNNSNNNNKSNIIGDNKIIKLEHVDQSSHDHDQAKLSKKHINANTHNMKTVGNKNIGTETILMNNAKPVKQIVNANDSSLTKSNIDITLLSYVNGNVSWSDYPFVALYVNEASQVHCDAAAISPHWLVASGACLSRVSKNPLSGTQSAFVAYCGERWWQPERVAYVKYILVHPSYNPRDKIRKQLHNIGVIQVVTSMLSACRGWASVSMISHQSAANQEGIEAAAIGWGLDRFGTRYGTADLPKIPLMIYKGLVYFGSCPGNVGYSKALRLGDGNGVKYVHCLSLPPYTSEANDPVHGGLLLAGGKLIALYLQEERRPWGHQSAQYTGIWPLIPWVMQVTREHEVESFTFEI